MKIVIGVIINQYQEILITQRAPNIPYGCYWEFPGGKIESNECPESALVRELKEELDIDVVDSKELGVVHYEHEFYVFGVTQFKGKIRLLANQPKFQWVTYRELRTLLFPPSNVHFFSMIQRYLQI